MRKVTKERETPQWLLKAAARVGENLWRGSDWVRCRLAGFAHDQLRGWILAFVLLVVILNTCALLAVLHTPQQSGYFGSATIPIRINAHHKRDSMRISRLRRYWDSVNLNPAMKKSLDSLSLIRPGFADTMHRLWGMAEQEK